MFGPLPGQLVRDLCSGHGCVSLSPLQSKTKSYFMFQVDCIKVCGNENGCCACIIRVYNLIQLTLNSYVLNTCHSMQTNLS